MNGRDPKKGGVARHCTRKTRRFRGDSVIYQVEMSSQQIDKEFEVLESLHCTQNFGSSHYIKTAPSLDESLGSWRESHGPGNEP